jgi:hypothetical protein
MIIFDCDYKVIRAARAYALILFKICHWNFPFICKLDYFWNQN